jgi:hypothetical protein
LLGVVVVLAVPVVPGVALSTNRPPALPLSASVVPHDAPALAGLGEGRSATGPGGSPPVPPSAVFVPRPTVVNPYAVYTHEPAPMGVADYGVNASGDAYNYSTTEFVGIARITNLSAGSTSGAGNLLGIQLDVVLELGTPTQPYDYWVRFAPWVNATTDVLTLQNEVFNFTSRATANPSPISGLGAINTMESDQYQYTPPCDSGAYPGNCEALPLPATLELRAESSDWGGVPTEELSYSLGGAWYAEDNITFPSHANLPDHNFVVDGRGYLPVGFADAEFVLGGPYAGYGQVNRGSAIQMGLEWLNGHNLEAIPNAWNFGSDTNNAVSNVTAGRAGSGPGGIPQDGIGTGSGSLGRLYTSSEMAQVTLIGGPPNGTVGVNGTPVAYTGGSAVLEVEPGPYTLTLLENGSAIDWANRTFTAGENVTVNLTVPEVVTLTESGLPSGANWSVAWGPSVYNSSSPAIEVPTVNGSYDVSVLPVSGYVTQFGNHVVVVHGSEGLSVFWHSFLWNATFGETGLPAGVDWWLQLDGRTTPPTANGSFVLEEPNGTYSFQVGAPYAYVGAEPSGVLNISPTSLSFGFEFLVRVSYIVGSATPVSVALTIDGIGIPLQDGSFNATVAPGVHTLTASAAGYVSREISVTSTPGNSTVVAIALNRTATSPPVAGGSGSSLSGSDELLLVGGAIGVAAVAAIGWIAWRRSRPGRPSK